MQSTKNGIHMQTNPSDKKPTKMTQAFMSLCSCRIICCMPRPVMPMALRYAWVMRSADTAANDSLVQKPSRTTKHASHSRTQWGLVPRLERAVPSQLMQSRALKLLSKVEVEVEVVDEGMSISTGIVSVVGVVEERVTEGATACSGSTNGTEAVDRAGVIGMSLCALSPVAVTGEQLLDL